jgi:hypothetical protein
MPGKGLKRLRFPRLESGWKMAGNRLAILRIQDPFGQYVRERTFRVGAVFRP